MSLKKFCVEHNFLIMESDKDDEVEEYDDEEEFFEDDEETEENFFDEDIFESGMESISKENKECSNVFLLSGVLSTKGRNRWAQKQRYYFRWKFEGRHGRDVKGKHQSNYLKYIEGIGRIELVRTWLRSKEMISLKRAI